MYVLAAFHKRIGILMFGAIVYSNQAAANEWKIIHNPNQDIPDPRISLPQKHIVLWIQPDENKSFLLTGDRTKINSKTAEPLVVDIDKRVAWLELKKSPLSKYQGTRLTDAHVCDLKAHSDRERFGLTICSSAFTTEIKDLGVLFKPFTALIGKDIMGVVIDRQRLQTIATSEKIEIALKEVEEAKNAEMELKQKIAAMKLQQELADEADHREKSAVFRNTLGVGDQTHCGLVVEVRPPIAKVQAKSGEKWLRIEKLSLPTVKSQVRLESCEP